jgi:hypothetical protein
MIKSTKFHHGFLKVRSQTPFLGHQVHLAVASGAMTSAMQTTRHILRSPIFRLPTNVNNLVALHFRLCLRHRPPGRLADLARKNFFLVLQFYKTRYTISIWMRAQPLIAFADLPPKVHPRLSHCKAILNNPPRSKIVLIPFPLLDQPSRR